MESVLRTVELASGTVVDRYTFKGVLVIKHRQYWITSKATQKELLYHVKTITLKNGTVCFTLLYEGTVVTLYGTQSIQLGPSSMSGLESFLGGKLVATRESPFGPVKNETAPDGNGVICFGCPGIIRRGDACLFSSYFEAYLCSGQCYQKLMSEQKT